MQRRLLTDFFSLSSARAKRRKTEEQRRLEEGQGPGSPRLNPGPDQQQENCRPGACVEQQDSTSQGPLKGVGEMQPGLRAEAGGRPVLGQRSVLSCLNAAA